MCDASMKEIVHNECNEEEKAKAQCSLDDIPIEVFLHICSYLDARFVVHTLRLVCKHFHCILSDDSIWKSRIGKRWTGAYPPLPVNSDYFNWKMACAIMEDEYNQWSRMEETMRHVLIKDIHYASVDAVLLMSAGSLLISGSRDYSLVAWNIENVPSDVENTTKKVLIDAHKGWIWNLAAYGDTLYSCSWDATVKTWDIEEGLREVSVFPCKNAALSLVCNANLVATGLYTRQVLMFDPRAGTKLVASYSSHLGPVLALAMDDDVIVSASEDKTIAVYDQRAGKILKKNIGLVEPSQSNSPFPMSLSFANNILYAGDTKGQLHLFNPREGRFELVETYSTGHTDKITGIQHSVGSIITSSTDGTVRIMTPTDKPEPIAVIESQGGEVTGFDYKNNILTMGGTNCAVEIWMPKSCE